MVPGFESTQLMQDGMKEWDVTKVQRGSTLTPLKFASQLRFEPTKTIALPTPLFTVLIKERWS